MAEVTVKQLADEVGTPVERLLQQMQEAGLPQTGPAQAVSDDEKQALLAFLKSAHGDSGSEPRKITLKRKTVSTLKVAGSKTVNVEVRKKRTYVKREPADLEAERAGEGDNEDGKQSHGFCRNADDVLPFHQSSHFTPVRCELPQPAARASVK